MSTLLKVEDLHLSFQGDQQAQRRVVVDVVKLAGQVVCDVTEKCDGLR